MRAYIGAHDLILFAALVSHVDDLDAPGSAQKRHGIADRPRRRSATVPAYHNVIQPERRSLNVGNDGDRPPGIEQRGFDDILLNHFGLRLRLPDNGQIEAPRDLAELIARADQACADCLPWLPTQIKVLQLLGFKSLRGRQGGKAARLRAALCVTAILGPNVRFGSKADMAACATNVHFAPKADVAEQIGTSLCAKSGHWWALTRFEKLQNHPTYARGRSVATLRIRSRWQGVEHVAGEAVLVVGSGAGGVADLPDDLCCQWRLSAAP